MATSVRTKGISSEEQEWINFVKLICKNKEELNVGLTEKQKETFEKFKDCQGDLTCIAEREAFTAGFILATRIMVEVMQGLEETEGI